MTLKEILTLLQYSYPRQQFENENVKAYTIMLRDVDLALLELAAFQIIRESVFFPSVSELIGKVADLQMQHEGCLSAIAAYEIAMRGSGKVLRDDYPEVYRAVQMACGDTYNMLKSESPVAERARFIEAYNEIIKTKRKAITDAPQVKKYLDSGESRPMLTGGTIHVEAI